MRASIEVGEQRLRARDESAGPGQVDRRLERLGRHVVVAVAVHERERAQPRRLAPGDDLRERAAGVVGDEVDGAGVDPVDERADGLGVRTERHVAVERPRALPVQRQVECDAALLARERVDHAPPQVGVGADAVHEHRRRRARGPTSR